MISSSQINSIKSLQPNQLNSYLSYSGWFVDGSINDIAQIWHRKESEFESFEIIQPSTKEIKDYNQRVYDLIEVLAEFENRSISGVINDLSNFFADVIKVRVIHEDVKEGSIPLNDGVLLFEKAKELMVSAVKSTYSKRKYFGGGKLADEIVNFLEKMRLGQTEHGSYVVNLIAPIMYKRGCSMKLEQYVIMINRILKKKGYKMTEGLAWSDLEPVDFQDDAFIAAAIVVYDEILND
jgi:hypothetical protein